MKIIKQSCEWVQEPRLEALKAIERAGRECYQTGEKITDDSFLAFDRKIMDSAKATGTILEILPQQHFSIIEHGFAHMRFVTDRGVTHEMVRHRLAAYSQESTRFCKYGNEITVIDPVFWPDRNSITSPDFDKYKQWKLAMELAETRYLALLHSGATPQEARSVLPNSLKTAIHMSCNLRQWRHFFTMRCAPNVHPQMRDLALQALRMFYRVVPVLFDDLAVKYLITQ